VQNEDGSLDFDFHVDTEEAAYLMDYAIKSLVNNGIIKLQMDEYDQQLDLFENCEGGLQ
jgi:hypothetical protein